MSCLDPNEISIVHWFNETEKHKCGYCKNEDSSISNGMWAETLTVQDYQNLIDRGWRRSGKYCYKPIMDQTCCPQYTIRCNIQRFNLTKSQKKVIKKFNKFCSDGVLRKEDSRGDAKDDEEGCSFDINYREGPSTVTDLSKVTKDEEVTAEGKIDAGSCIKEISSPIKKEETPAKSAEETQLPKPEVKYKKGDGADPNKPPCKKAKLLRLERKQEKLLKRGMSLEKLNTEPQTKTLKQFLEDIPKDAKHKLTTCLISTNQPGPDWDQFRQTEFELYRKYQMSVHNDPPERCTMHGFTRFLINSPLKIKLERMFKKHKLFSLSSELFAKYQIAVHNESSVECDEKQFFDFLVDSPLQSEEGDGFSYGSFHQQYWLDDKLIAVGVIDILPKCVSSVYFFYDPDYRSLTLGTYGSLREVQFTRDLHEKNTAIEHYYMGFYIHSCPKMRYKGKLTGSDLLCPDTYTWIPIEKCIPKLDINKYSRLNDDLDALDENHCSPQDVDEIKVLVGHKFMYFSSYKRKKGQQKMFDNIGELIGKKCTRTLLFVV